MQKSKVAIFIYYLGGGGAERTAANLLNCLNREKYDVQLILMNTLIDYAVPADLKIQYIEKSNANESDLWKLIKLPFLAYKLARYCKKEKIDLIFTLMNRPNMIATMAKYFGLSCPVLISEQTYTPMFYNSKTVGNRLKKWVLKKAYSKADCILPNSEGTKQALANEFKINTNYSVIKNPTNIEEIIKVKDEPTDSTINFNQFTFINVAAFREQKNHELLINAAAELNEFDFQLLFIGKGILLETLQQKVKHLGLTHKVFFLDFTPNPFKYLSRADCFLLSSFGEGFPNILIESMVCQLPIISVDCKTGPRELLAPGTNLNTVIPDDQFEIAAYGILCADNSLSSMKQAMTWALTNPDQLAAYKEKISTKAKEFEINQVCEEFSLIFDSYLKRSR